MLSYLWWATLLPNFEYWRSFTWNQCIFCGQLAESLNCKNAAVSLKRSWESSVRDLGGCVERTLNLRLRSAPYALLRPIKMIDFMTGRYVLPKIRPIWTVEFISAHHNGYLTPLQFLAIGISQPLPTLIFTLWYSLPTLIPNSQKCHFLLIKFFQPIKAKLSGIKSWSI